MYRWIFSLVCMGSCLFAMDRADLEKWDHILGDEKIADVRLYAYLYTAQQRAASLALEKTGCFSGSLDPVSYEVVRWFLPDIKVDHLDDDSFSKSLADEVLPPLRQRFEEEKRCLREENMRHEKTAWYPGNDAPYGITFASWRPWYILSRNQFRPASPPPPLDPFWQKQIGDIKQVQANLTEKERETIFYWARPFVWFRVLQNYLKEHDVDFCKELKVRGVFARAVVDTDIAIFDSKYFYLVRRPFMIDASIKSPIVVPNHPSFPSGHSTEGGMAATLLSFYFPEDCAYWFCLAQEAGYSRICAGIHYPIDHEVGFKMGRKIAEWVIENAD